MTTGATRVRPIAIHRRQFGIRVRALRFSPTYGDSPRFRFINETKLTVAIDFQRDDVVLRPDGAPIRTLEVAPLGESDELQISTGAKPGTYPYVVFIKEAGIEAESGSRPEIEIER